MILIYNTYWIFMRKLIIGVSVHVSDMFGKVLNTYRQRRRATVNHTSCGPYMDSMSIHIDSPSIMWTTQCQHVNHVNHTLTACQYTLTACQSCEPHTDSMSIHIDSPSIMWTTQWQHVNHVNHTLTACQSCEPHIDSMSIIYWQWWRATVNHTLTACPWCEPHIDSMSIIWLTQHCNCHNASHCNVLVQMFAKKQNTITARNVLSTVNLSNAIQFQQVLFFSCFKNHCVTKYT